MRESSLARDTAVIGMFIAMQIVLTKVLSIETPYLRIDFAFIPIALCAMLYGPVKGGISAAVGDVIGVMLFPQFPFFPGFTLSAFLAGALYGLFLYRKPKSAFRFAVPVIIILIVKNLGLDTLWVLIITTDSFFELTLLEIIGRFIAWMPIRLIHSLMVPVQIITLSLLWYAMKPYETRFTTTINDTAHE